MKIRFIVYGKAIPQGNKIGIPVCPGGVPLIRNGRQVTRVVEKNPKLHVWRQQVAEVATAECFGEYPTLEPVRLSMTFTRPRPKGHFGTGRNASKLKASAPEHPTTTPDTLKLARAVEDSLTGIFYKDDSQVVEHRLYKVYGHQYMVEVVAETIT